MAQHISIRVPWHDNGWKGSVCKDPSANMACLKLKNITENRDDAFECSICGQCMVEQEEKLPCIGEGGAFMSDQELHKSTVHPYKQNNPQTHVWYWEHCGMMSDSRYAKRWHDKEKFYAKNGIVRGKNLIVTEEYAGEGLDSFKINELIKEVFLL